MQNKLSANVLVNTFTNLNLLSSIDYKIKLANWVDQAKRHIPDMTEQEANIYFITYKALLENVDSPGQGGFSNNQATGGNVSIKDYQVDVRCFAIFIAL